MMYVDSGEINMVYPKLIQSVMLFGQEVVPRGQRTRELHPVLLEVHNPRNRLVTSYGRPVNVAFALAEVLWILSGRDDVAMLKFYNSNISDYSDDGVRFNAAYGARLRSSFGHDQLEDVIRTLQDDPDTRQATIVLSHPEHDRGWELGGTPKHVTKDRACNVLSHPMIREGALDWYHVIRSNDALWGTPYNWMQWTHVQEYVARRLGVPVGKFLHNADSLHVYERQFEETLRIREFDLYKHLGWEHDEMWVDDLPAVYAAEEEMRLHAEVSLPALVGPYWRSVLLTLQAFAAYKAGEDGECLAALTSDHMDPLYGLASMRFYYYWRWYKPEYEPLRQVIDDLVGDEVWKWVRASHA